VAQLFLSCKDLLNWSFRLNEVFNKMGCQNKQNRFGGMLRIPRSEVSGKTPGRVLQEKLVNLRKLKQYLLDRPVPSFNYSEVLNSGKEFLKCCSVALSINGIGKDHRIPLAELKCRVAESGIDANQMQTQVNPANSTARNHSL
jgi:hypothetical protein